MQFCLNMHERDLDRNFLIFSLFINCITAYQRCFKNNDDDDGNGDGDEYNSHYVDDDE